MSMSAKQTIRNLLENIQYTISQFLVILCTAHKSYGSYSEKYAEDEH